MPFSRKDEIIPATAPSTQSPAILTLTLNEEPGERKTGALVAQRGDLGKVFQFTYTGPLDLVEGIRHALDALNALEADPPALPDPPKPASSTRPEPKTPPPPAEPTIDVPLRKGTKAVRISHLKLVGGETDAAAYRQAVLLAGKLIDGGLWDGESPIRIDDVYALARKLKPLTERELSLFTLEDFVQVGKSPRL
ncbi:MAG: hypothetical protein IPK19_41335 [Chloroflexi bacterium]|nr:hypothetical protein [Chloroflexota bacterium]